MPDDVRPEACPECGATPLLGRPCPALFHALLHRTSATGPSLYGLVVACYTLQHPARQRRESVEWALLQLPGAVAHGLPLDDWRGAARAHFDQRRGRACDAADGTARSTVAAPATWRLTIRQVVAGTPGGDAERILEWARTILEDTGSASAR